MGVLMVGPVVGILVVFAGLTVGAGTKTKDMLAHVNTTARLPCPVNPGLCGKLHSVKWYKDTSRIYVLSHSGSVKRPEGDAKERMKVEYPTDSGQAILQIEDIQIEDEAIYKCEITYIEVKESCHEVVQIVNLTTLVSPKEVKVLKDNQLIKNYTQIGPYDEGDEVDLICEAGPGKPTPRVSWYNGTTLISRAQYTVKEEKDGLGTGISKLQLSLSRGDLRARFECRVESEALEQPIVSTLSADLNVKPTSMKMTGPPTYAVQGSNVMVMCDVFGARPAAKVRWTNGSTPITNETLVSTDLEQMKDGTFNTKSQLLFQATHYENGMKIHCYAENEVMNHKGEPEGHQLFILEVRYPPVIVVSPKYITVKEGANKTSLKCNYKANPQELEEASWRKDDDPADLDLTDEKKYKGGTIENPPLNIYNISRDDMGNYSCHLRNAIGPEKSPDSIFLNVEYAPDVEVFLDPATPVRAMDKVTVMIECNVTFGNPRNLTKVRWFMDGELMKEVPECNSTAQDGGPFCGLDPSFLSLERVDERFAGNYTCQGENVAGWGPVSEPVELIVYYPPSPAKIRSYPTRVIKGGEVNLECKVESPGRPDNVTYLWFRSNHQMTEITASKLRIAPVGLETNSNFTCIAKNEGGQSEPATLFVNVNAPPALFTRPASYQGILYSAQLINLTCRVECSPLCKIVWKKNGKLIDFANDPLYYNKTIVHEQDLRKNVFESIESTLIWNMTAWPGNKLDRTAPNTNYTCQSDSNGIGPGVNSTIEIAVDYPPECSITRTSRDSSAALLCTVQANPQEVSFFWKAREGNETYNLVDSSSIQTDGLKSYLILDSTVDTKRTYQCFANNSVGFSDKQPCEMDVAGILPWWKRLTKENLYIIIASIIAIIICVIIICIVIIILCRRKRAGTKSPVNPSSIVGDKIRPGVVRPLGSTKDHPSTKLAEPSDEGFYENLPFHGMSQPPNKNAFYTLTAPLHCKQQTVLPPQYSATIPHPQKHQNRHAKLTPKALFQEQLSKSKSFNSKSSSNKHKRSHFQIPLQKCHSFKFQTAESYFQPIKNIHEENLMRNGYATDYPATSSSTNSLHRSRAKRDKPKQKTKGPLVLRHPGPDFPDSSVRLQYPQPINPVNNRPNGAGAVQYADLDMSDSRKSSSSSASNRSHSGGGGTKKQKKTEYATLRFDEVGQEIDV